MNREKELSLLEELLGLADNGQFFLGDETTRSPMERYICPQRFASEQENIFKKMPLIACHSSELPEPGSFLTKQLGEFPVLLTRDKEGEAHAFVNICRHRGVKLVNQEAGCKHLFSCPYHAWTYSNKGDLRSITHQAGGFPDVDKSEYGLRRLSSLEAHGFCWVIPSLTETMDIAAFVEPLAQDLQWMDMENHAIAQSNTVEIKANWKLLVEGGIEAYHFKVAHKNTIGPHFMDNLSSYEMLGSHSRSILPRTLLTGLKDQPRESWAIRDVSNVLYNVFPTSQLLLMQDHIAWIDLTPLSEGLTRAKFTTLAPKAEITPEKEEHWKRNHEITVVTLEEDFVLNEASQIGCQTGTNTFHTFGRYEGALNAFNLEVERYL